MTSRWDKLRKTTEQFVDEAQQRHGQRYDYALVDYFNCVTPVTIICPTHGPFQQKPDGHLRGQGCARCGREKPRRPAHRSTSAGFIERAKAKHPTEGYDYSQVTYIDQWTPVTIICPTHGPFQQKPYSHLTKRRNGRGTGYRGCQRCGIELARESARLTHDEFLAAAHARHGDRYGYSLVVYVEQRQQITIICRDHGPFTQTGASHLAGQGCRRCQIEGFRLSAADYLAKVADVYDEAFQYPNLGRFVLASDRVQVECPVHGRFDVNSRTHMEGRSNCPGCTTHGSRFERRIQRALTVAGIEHETQWTHPTLKDRKLLRIDFMIPESRTLIEFDGAFHFRPIQMPGQSWETAVRVFEETKRRDAIKTSWASSNGWHLVRISSARVEHELATAGIIPTRQLTTERNPKHG